MYNQRTKRTHRVEFRTVQHSLRKLFITNFRTAHEFHDGHSWKLSLCSTWTKTPTSSCGIPFGELLCCIACCCVIWVGTFVSVTLIVDFTSFRVSPLMPRLGYKAELTHYTKIVILCRTYAGTVFVILRHQLLSFIVSSNFFTPVNQNKVLLCKKYYWPQ